MKFTAEFRSSLVTIAASALCGALAGSISGSIFAQLPAQSVAVQQTSTSSTATPMGIGATTTDSTNPDIKVVSIEPSAPQQITPPVFKDRSPAAGILYHVSAKQGMFLRESDMIGQAVALTSDGWFAVPLSAIKGLKLSEIVIWKEGKVSHPTKGIADTAASIAFLKTDLKNDSTPAFARFSDLARGMSAWVERRPGNYDPEIIASLNEDESTSGSISSEQAQRRLVLSGTSTPGDVGAPVWSSEGVLIGIVSSSNGALRVLPSSAWTPALFSAFVEGSILFPTLGVRDVDLSFVRLANAPANLPARGAWLTADANTKLPAIVPGSPADAAGLKEGDVIQLVDRDILDGRADLAETLVQYKPGSRVTLTVVRDGQTLEIPVTLGSTKVSEEIK
ncbi:MAG: PDZ domain-containing protein [Patescibacteria group bacterium]